MALTLTVTNYGEDNQLIGVVTGVVAGTNVILAGRDYQEDDIPIGALVGSTTPAGSVATITAAWPERSLYYFNAWQNQIGAWQVSNQVALWLGDTGLQRSDRLSQALKDILSNNAPGLQAAWTQFATAAGYTVGTIGTANIVVGDRLKPTRNAVTICIIGDKEDIGLTDVAIGAFGQYARRLIRGYVNLVPKNETEQRETERERLRDTLRAAVVDILLNNYYHTVTDGEAWVWFNCRPIDSDVGEIIRNNEFVWAFEVVWQAETQGDR